MNLLEFGPNFNGTLTQNQGYPFTELSMLSLSFTIDHLFFHLPKEGGKILLPKDCGVTQKVDITLF